MTGTAIVPRAWRNGISRALGRLDERAIAGEVRALAAGSNPIVVGPWTGEVGFEVLYWIPFLRWVLRDANVPRDRVIACSRGGVDTWYADIASRYVEIFDFVTPAELLRESAARKTLLGEQKQTTRSGFDDALVAKVGSAVGSDVQVLHPASMFRLYRRYFWKHAGTEWLHRVARYQKWSAAPDAPPLPESFVAVKLYFNDCMSDSTATRHAMRDLVAGISAHTPIVSLATGLEIDDHSEMALPDAIDVPGLSDARTNLMRQAAILSRARAFVGTYGGYAYVPPFYGVPTTAVFTRPDGFDRSHLAMAQSALGHIGAPRLNVMPLADAVRTVPAWWSALVSRNSDSLHKSRSAAPGSQGATSENIGHI
jgi:hypothetical protein